jgi:hypothetical protein
MKTKNSWFEVDRDGLKQLLGDRSRTFAVAELIQNAWDQNVSEVSLTIEKDRNSRAYRVTVIDDDPNGWKDIKDAFTLFKPSLKKSDPEKRGRFNLGEKLVLALCKEAEIVSVDSAIAFDKAGRRLLRKRVDKGSVFSGLIDLRADEIREFGKHIKTFLAPSGIATTVNLLGDKFELRQHEQVSSFDITLPTVTSDAEGNIKRTTRKTVVELFEVQDGETASIYEMGIPVVGLDGDKWHINVQQKIPLNLNRDNVTPAYLAQLRVAVLNEAGALLTKKEFTDDWVSSAAADERAQDDVVDHVLTSRFGEKRVAYDPTDPEANKIATSKGYTVISGGGLSGGLWRNAKRSDSIRPAGQVTPSPKAYSSDPDATPVPIVNEADWTEDHRRFVSYAKQLHIDLIGEPLNVRVVKVRNFGAAYSRCHLDINANNGKGWFEKSNFEEQLSLLLHEFAHYYCGDHLSHKFHDAICNLGAKLAVQLGASRY